MRDNYKNFGIIAIIFLLPFLFFWRLITPNTIDKRYIKEGESFFVNRTNLTHKGRMKFINRAKQAGFKIKVTVLMSSLDEIDKRNQNRVGKIIPNHVFTNMMKSFDMPFADEGEVIYHFNYSIGETNV